MHNLFDELIHIKKSVVARQHLMMCVTICVAVDALHINPSPSTHDHLQFTSLIISKYYTYFVKNIVFLLLLILVRNGPVTDVLLDLS